MRIPGFIMIGIAVILFLIGFIPDRTDKVQFIYRGEDILQRIDTDYSNIPIFADADTAKEFIKNGDLVIDAQIPKSILVGRRSHVQMTAQWIERSETSQPWIVSDGFMLEIKSHLDFPRQFIEPVGYNSKPVTDQVSPAFHWNLLSDKPETLNGKLWIYLALKNKQELTIEYPLLARDIKIPTTTILGVNLATSRIVSLCIGIFGMAILLLKIFIGKIKHLIIY